MHVHSNPDLAKYAALPARLRAQWAVAWLSEPTFYADLCSIFPDPDDRRELLLLMDAALSALIRETAP